jgi:tRNA threonylcarbamoyladenosine biosynthesis protein TsaB
LSFTDYIKKMLTGQLRNNPHSADQIAPQTSSGAIEKTGPTLLAIDTASTSLSTAVLVNGEVKGELYEDMERGQAENLMRFIAESLDQAGITFDEVDGVAVTVGPGAFTGMRIGLATARALGLARKIPVVGVSSLEAVAYGVSERDQQGRNILVALDSKRNEIFAQAFDGKKRPLSAPECVAPRQALMMAPPGDTLLTAAAHAPDAFYDCTAPGLPRAGNVARIAAARWGTDENLPPVPMYLRAPDARRIEDQGPAKNKPVHEE